MEETRMERVVLWGSSSKKDGSLGRRWNDNIKLDLIKVGG
jgi:hypothetical protein